MFKHILSLNFRLSSIFNLNDVENFQINFHHEKDEGQAMKTKVHIALIKHQIRSLASED